jgi:hypothetical protein
MELLIKLNLYEIIIVSVGTSLLVEALKHLFPKIKTKITLPNITLLFTMLRIFPLESINFEQPSTMIFNFLLTVSFTILFYKYGGERIVKFLVGTITNRIENTSKAKEGEPFE